MSLEERHPVRVGGHVLALVLHLPAGDGSSPCVVACHGLSASKDSDKYLLLGAEVPRAGIALARFDFRGCGESTGIETDTTIATMREWCAVIWASTRSRSSSSRWARSG